jgi:hypothetical protein
VVVLCCVCGVCVAEARPKPVAPAQAPPVPSPTCRSGSGWPLHRSLTSTFCDAATGHHISTSLWHSLESPVFAACFAVHIRPTTDNQCGLQATPFCASCADPGSTVHYRCRLQTGCLLPPPPPLPLLLPALSDFLKRRPRRPVAETRDGALRTMGGAAANHGTHTCPVARVVVSRGSTTAWAWPLLTVAHALIPAGAAWLTTPVYRTSRSKGCALVHFERCRLGPSPSCPALCCLSVDPGTL